MIEWVSLCNVCFQVCTSSIRLKTVRASDCRSTPRTASTVKRAISRIPVRISTGWCPREEEDQPITACKCGWGSAKQSQREGSFGVVSTITLVSENTRCQIMFWVRQTYCILVEQRYWTGVPLPPGVTCYICFCHSQVRGVRKYPRDGLIFHSCFCAR